MSEAGKEDSRAGPAPNTVVAQKYRLGPQLGSGAMGRVFRAEHLILERPVAIKFVLGVAGVKSRRFLREAQTAQALSSEHILRVFDVGFHDELPYIVMELLDGEDLDAVLASRGPLPFSEAVDYVLQACLGVAEAHAAGIVHRDIKPSNLFLTRTATGAPLIKVLDFGISKVLEPEKEDAEGTAAGSLLGSPYYMSPEQLRNPKNVDGRTDVWALAVTLYTLLANSHPFEGNTISEVTAAIFTDPPLPLLERSPNIPEELSAVLCRALAKRPEDRTPSVAAFAQDNPSTVVTVLRTAAILGPRCRTYLADYLRAEGITHLVDATHPFAAQMSRNAVAACGSAGIPYCAYERAPWVAGAHALVAGG